MQDEPGECTSPDCPRCGYDLVGVVRSWQEMCPLYGECSECGLSIAWAELLNPRLTMPRCSFEHAHQPGPRRMVQTAAECLLPLRFWRRLRLEHPIHGRRLAVFGICIALVTHVSVGVLCGWLAYDVLARGIPLYKPGDWFWPRSEPQSVTLALVNARPVADWSIILSKALRPYDNPVGGGGWLIVAVLWPLLVPAFFLALPHTMRQCRVRRAHLWRAMVYTLPSVACMLLLWTALRIGSTIVNRLANTSVLHTLLADLTEPAETLTDDAATLLVPIAAALTLSWWAITRRYLRLPHAAGIVAAAIGMSGILAFLIVLFCDWENMSNRITWW